MPQMLSSPVPGSGTPRRFTLHPLASTGLRVISHPRVPESLLGHGSLYHPVAIIATLRARMLSQSTGTTSRLH